MKKIIKSTFIPVLFVGLLFCLPLFGGCEKNTVAEDTNTVSLSEIAEDPSYANLPLIGTKWKLVEFVDKEKSLIKLAEPSDNDIYTIIFHEFRRFSGKSSTNVIEGEFEFDENTATLEVKNIGGTKINEILDGRKYMSLLESSKRYEITEKGLLLFSNGTTYLLFNPSESQYRPRFQR